jgi:tetratricopeptide (TPR) repeat protein
MGQSADSVEALVNMNLTVDVRIFTVMAALNAAGFDYETPGKAMSEVRQGIRQELQRTDPGLLAQLQAFYKEHRQGTDGIDNQVSYVSLALLLSGPPEFKLIFKEDKVPADARRLLGFELLIQEFYQKAGIQSMWQRYQSAYTEELDDLLNAKNIVNARSLEPVYYIVVGPTDNATENHRQLQHGYLHYLIDPLVEKFGLQLLKHSDLMDLAHRQPQLDAQYQNKYFLLVAESLIETILWKIHVPEDPDRELVSLFRQGFIFVPYFQRGLKRYEETELISFPSYVEDLFKDLDESQIEEDEKVIAALESDLRIAREKEAQSQQRTQEEVDRRNRVNSLLNQAVVLLSKREYLSAGEQLQNLLREDPENGNAYFYLAQIASQQEQYEEAIQYYTRATESPGVPEWVQGWSLLRIGNYQAFQGDFGRARTYFDRVLEMEGDLQGAKEEAQKSIEKLP